MRCQKAAIHQRSVLSDAVILQSYKGKTVDTQCETTAFESYDHSALFEWSDLACTSSAPEASQSGEISCTSVGLVIWKQRP